jgi:hypothetical protein
MWTKLQDVVFQKNHNTHDGNTFLNKFQLNVGTYTEKTKYMLLSRHQNAGQNHDIKIGNRYFENVA